MREFASAGGELVIHAALHPKNSPTPQLIACQVPSCDIKTICFLIETGSETGNDIQ
jgi:hypothetical protein